MSSHDHSKGSRKHLPKPGVSLPTIRPPWQSWCCILLTKGAFGQGEDNVKRFLNSLDWSLVNEAPKPNPGKMPASFALPASPTGKKKMSRQVTKSKGWNNCLLEICELMQSRYPESFRQNILSMTDRFAETENSKFSVPVGDVGIYARFGNAKEIREACYEIVTKFDYPRNSLVIRDSRRAQTCEPAPPFDSQPPVGASLARHPILMGWGAATMCSLEYAAPAKSPSFIPNPNGGSVGRAGAPFLQLR